MKNAPNVKTQIRNEKQCFLRNSAYIKNIKWVLNFDFDAVQNPRNISGFLDSNFDRTFYNLVSHSF